MVRSRRHRPSRPPPSRAVTRLRTSTWVRVSWCGRRRSGRPWTSWPTTSRPGRASRSRVTPRRTNARRPRTATGWPGRNRSAPGPASSPGTWPPAVRPSSSRTLVRGSRTPASTAITSATSPRSPAISTSTSIACPQARPTRSPTGRATRFSTTSSGISWPMSRLATRRRTSMWRICSSRRILRSTPAPPWAGTRTATASAPPTTTVRQSRIPRRVMPMPMVSVTRATPRCRHARHPAGYSPICRSEAFANWPAGSSGSGAMAARRRRRRWSCPTMSPWTAVGISTSLIRGITVSGASTPRLD